MNMSDPVTHLDLDVNLKERIARVVADRLAIARALGGVNAEPVLLAAILSELGAEVRAQQERGRAANF